METCLTKLAQINIHYWNKYHGWSSRHSCPPQIQLLSKMTGAVLMRRTKDSQETCLTKLAQNSLYNWNKCHGWSSRHSCPPQIQLKRRRTGPILTRRTDVLEEVDFTKVKILKIWSWNQNFPPGSLEDGYVSEMKNSNVLPHRSSFEGFFHH